MCHQAVASGSALPWSRRESNSVGNLLILKTLIAISDNNEPNHEPNYWLTLVNSK